MGIATTCPNHFFHSAELPKKNVLEPYSIVTMSFSRGFALLLLGCAVVSAFDHELTNTPNPAEEETARGIFAEWVKLFEKAYDTVEEAEARFATFKDNMKLVHEHNSKESSYKLGLNHMADLTKDEYRNFLGYRAARNHWELFGALNTTFTHREAATEASVDWRGSAVTDIKNQAQCGSCWAFSTTGSVEGIHYITSGELVSLSEQELVSCDSTDLGCNGGSMESAMQWIINNGGISTEEEYPYTSGGGTSGSCKHKKTKDKAVQITGYHEVPASSLSAMKKAVSKQPISVAIEADQSAFQLYRSGVFDGTCGTSLDHGVLIVGYGSEDGEEYFIVKNSWGTTWGEEGYMRMAVGSSSAGTCGILLDGCYPTADYVEVQKEKPATITNRKISLPS